MGTVCTRCYFGEFAMKDYLQLKQYLDWFAKNPAMGVISVVCFVAGFIMFLYLCECMDQWEEKNKKEKRRR